MKLLSNLKFHHFGLAVFKEDEALKVLSLLQYDISEKIYDPLQDVNLIMCCHSSDPDIEIITPGSTKSKVNNLISKYNELFYHSCYTTNNLIETIKSIEDNGLRCVCLREPKPAILFQNKLVSFYKIYGYGIIEFIEN